MWLGLSGVTYAHQVPNIWVVVPVSGSNEKALQNTENGHLRPRNPSKQIYFASLKFACKQKHLAIDASIAIIYSSNMHLQ